MISTNSNEGIRSAINGLKIIVKGKCSITCGSESVLYVEKYTFIIGSSLADELALVCNSSAQYSSAAALKLDTTTCEIKNCSVVVESAYYSIGLGWYSSGGRSLILDNAKLSITGNGRHASLGYISSLRLKGCAITKPKGAKFDGAERSVIVIEGGKKQDVKGDIVIEPMSVVPVTELTLTPTEATLKEEEEITLGVLLIQLLQLLRKQAK